MKSSTKFSRRVCAAVVACAALLVSQAQADARKFDTPVGEITLQIDSEWQTMRDVPDGIGFEIAGGRRMQFLLRSLTVEIPEGMSDSEAREIVSEIRREYAAEGAQSGPLQRLTGTYVSGHYVQLTNPERERVEGDHQFIYVGFVRTGSKPILFVIGWGDDGRAAAARALESVRSMRVRPR